MGPVLDGLPGRPAVRWLQSATLAAGCWVRAHYPAIFVAVFLGLLLLPLQNFPGNFTDFQRRFWGYDELIRGYTDARFTVLKDTVIGDIFARPGGWLVYTGETSLDDYQQTRPFTQVELARIQHNLDGLDQRLSAQGITLLVVIVPGKNTIYPERMPAEIPVLGQTSRTDQLMDYLGQHSQARVLDLRPALAEAKQARQVYYATDTHWNPYGILAGYQAILAALRPDFPTLQAHTLDDFRPVSTGLGSGDLSKEWLGGLAQEAMTRLEPRFKRETTQFTLTQGTALVPGRMVATYNPNSQLPRAVIFHDSFFNDMIPFLSDHFSWAIYHWAFKVDENLIQGEKPQIVIFEVTDRYLARLVDFTRP